jgi:hypothetical protein
MFSILNNYIKKNKKICIVINAIIINLNNTCYIEKSGTSNVFVYSIAGLILTLCFKFNKDRNQLYEKMINTKILEK